MVVLFLFVEFMISDFVVGVEIVYCVNVLDEVVDYVGDCRVWFMVEVECFLV